MNPKLIISAITFLSSPAGQKLVGKLTDGTEDALKLGGSLLHGLGDKDYNPSEEDASSFIDLANAYKGSQSSAPMDSESVLRQAEDRMKIANSLYNNQTSRLFIDSPKKMAAKIGLNALSNTAKAAGDMAENNGNRLAAAIMQGFRDHSSAQDERYGPSARDKANAMYAQNKMRTGTNKGIIGKAIGDTIDRGLNAFEQQDLAAKQFAMTEATGRVPSALYDLFGRQTSAQNKNKR